MSNGPDLAVRFAWVKIARRLATVTALLAFLAIGVVGRVRTDLAVIVTAYIALVAAVVACWLAAVTAPDS